VVRNDLVLVVLMGEGKELGQGQKLWQRENMTMLQRDNACLKSTAKDMTQHRIRHAMCLIVFLLSRFLFVWKVFRLYVACSGF